MPVQRCGNSGWRWGKHGKCYTGPHARALAARQGRAILATGWTENAQVKLRRNPLAADPSRTGALRLKFIREVDVRLNMLLREIVDLVAKEDAFGLRPPQPFRTTRLLVNERWRFMTAPAKVASFLTWLKDRIKQLFTREDDEDAYWERYVQEGFEKGAGRAFDQVRKGLISSQRQLDFYSGTKRQFLQSSFAQPETVEKVKLLASRTLTDLKNVGEDMAARMSRTLTDGLVQGQNPNAIARTMRKDLGVARSSAERIARTEIIRAHAEGQLDALEGLGVQDVGVAVEWSTAKDGRVCPKCQPMQGVVFKIKESHGLLPRHPNCRCAFIPANVGESQKAQIRTKPKILAAISKSIAAERPKRKKRTLKEQRRLSKWIGADLKLDQNRPKSII